MKKIVLSLVAAASLFAATSFAADANIGIVDVQKILETSPKATTLRDKLKKEFTADREKLMQQSKTLQANMDDYQKNQSIMSKSDLDALKKKIIQERDQLGQQQNDLQQKYFQARDEAMNTILKSVHDSAAKVAQEKGLDMVMAKSTLIYVKDGNDITAEVLKGMQ